MLALVYPAFVGLLASANVVQSGFTGLVVPAHVLTESVVLGHAFEPTVFNDRVLKARKPCATGEILFEWHEGACLTAAAAYSDLDVGRHLRDIAPRVGPGFETVAIATLLAGEWVRDFRTRPTSIMPEGGDQSAFENLVPSQWSVLTKALWADANNIEDVDPGLQPLVQQGVQLMMPALDHTSRAAWSCGQGSRSQGELLAAAEAAIKLVLQHQRFEESIEGPALLPLLDQLTTSDGANENAHIVAPKESGACLQCVAAKDIAVGDAIFIGDA